MAEDVQNIQVAGGVRMQGVDSSQLQQLQFNSVQQQQTMMHVGGAGMDGSQLQMNQTEVVQQGQVSMQQLSPVGMVGGQMVGGQMGRAQMVGGQMSGGQITGNQMIGRQIPSGQLSPGSLAAGQMAGCQMIGGQMAGGQIVGGQMGGGQVGGSQMNGIQMAGGQMFSGQTTPGQLSPGQISGGQMVVGQVGGGQTPGQLSPGQMAGGQMVGGQMVGGQLAVNSTGQVTGGQVAVSPTGQMVVGQMGGGQTPGQISPGQMAGGQMVGGQLAVSSTGQATGGQVAVSPTGQMVGGQMDGGQMDVSLADQIVVQMSSGQVTSNAEMSMSGMVSDEPLPTVGSVEMAVEGVVPGDGGNVQVVVGGEASAQGNSEMVNVATVGEIGQAGSVNEMTTVGQNTTNEVSVVSEISMVESSMATTTIETTTVIQSEEVVESQQTVQEGGYSMEVVGTVNPHVDQVDAGYSMEVIGTIDSIPQDLPNFTVETIGTVNQEGVSCVSKTTEIQELNEKIDSMKEEFEKERDEMEARYIEQMKAIETRHDNEKEEMRKEAQKDEYEYEEKLKNERTQLNEVQFKLSILQAEMDKAEKSNKRQRDEFDELEEKLRKTKGERDQVEEMNRRLKMELQRIQQQGYCDKNLIKKLQAKLSQASTVEKEVHIKLVREKEKVTEYSEKIIMIENTVATLEKQNRDCMNEIEMLNEKLKKEKRECESLRALLSEEAKDDEKQGLLITELQSKVKELNSATDELDRKWNVDKEEVKQLNTKVFQLNFEKTKFEKLYKEYKEDVEELTGKYTREKNEVERLEEELAKLRMEQSDSNSYGDVENIVAGLEEKIRRLTADCDSFEEKYKYEKREKAEFEDKYHRAKSEVADLQEKYRRVDIEKDSISRKYREISDTYERKIRVLQQQITELRSRPSAPVQTAPQSIAVVSYPSSPYFVDTMAELGISMDKYNEMKHQKDSIEQRYNALVELLAKYEDEVQTLERENKEMRLSVTDMDYTSINITTQESNVSSGSYSNVEFRRLLDEKDYFEGRYKKEKAERENAEKKLRDLRHEKENLDDKLNDVAKVITRYEQDVRLCRNENDQLRRQFQELFVKEEIQKSVSVEYSVKEERRDSDKSVDKYKHEIDELHRENEEFKQLLDSLDGKVGGKGDKNADKSAGDRVSALESEVASLNSVIVELEKTIAYQDKTAEDGRMQLEDEKWRLRKHVQKLEDKVKEQVRMIDEYDRKMVELRGKFTDEVSNLGDKLLNEVDRNVKLEEHIKHLQKHLADLDGERKEILIRFDAVASNETEFVRDLEDLEDRYKVDIMELQNRLTMEMNEKGNLTRDIQHLLDELDNLRTRESAIETQFVRERDEIKGRYESEKIDMLRQYHDENTRIKVQLDEETRKRKGLEDEVDRVKRTGVSAHTVAGGDSTHGRNLGDLNVVLDDEKRRGEHLQEENKKLLYQMNLILSQKEGGGNPAVGGSSDSYDDVSRIKRKLVHVEEERDKFERSKKDLEYELDRNKSKLDNLHFEVERCREVERKNRETTDELRSLKSLNDELNRKQRDLIADNDNLSRTVQEMERDNRKLTMEIDHLTMQLKKRQERTGRSGGSYVDRDDTDMVPDNVKASSDEILKIKYDFENKLKEQMDANRQLEKSFHNLQREMDGMQDSRSLMQSHFNQQKEILMQQVAAGSVRGDVERETQRQTEEWKRMIDDSERRFKNELNRIESQKQEQYNALKREKDLMTEHYGKEKEEMRRKIFDIEEQMRRKEMSWQSSSPAPVHHAPYPGQQMHGRDDMQSVVREKDSYIEQLKTEKYEGLRNFEREKNRMIMDSDMERNKSKKTIDELEDTVRSLRKQKNELEEKVKDEMIRDLEMKYAREKDRMEHNFDEEKRQLKKSLDRNLESKSDDVKREYENKYTRIINDLEREKARLLGRLERERGGMLSYDGHINQSSSTYGDTTVVISRYEEENRQLQKQLKDQTQSFELEKQELIKRYEQEKRSIEARLIHEKKVLEISVQAMTREIAKLKHERNEIRKNYKAEIDKLRLQIERGGIDVRDSSNTRDTREVIQSVHTSSSSHASLVMSYEEKHSFEKTIDGLKEKAREYETTVQKLKRNHTEEIRFMMKNFENEKADLENTWVLERGWLEASIEANFEKKLTEEKKKFENTMTALRREVNCLQDQRRLLQMKITSNSLLVGDKNAFEKSVNDHKRDVLEKLQREYAERIERERRPLEETIKELRRDVEELRRERNEARANLRQEKLRLQEEFDRERERLLQERIDIKSGDDGFGRGGRFKPGDNERVPDEDGPLGHIQKSVQESTVKGLETENDSLKEVNSRLGNELRSLTAKLESLEIRNKHLAIAQNKKDRPRRGYGSGSPSRPNVLDGLVPRLGPQPMGDGRSPDRRYPATSGVSGQRFPEHEGGSSPLRGGRSPDGRYPGSVNNISSQRGGPFGMLSPDRSGTGLLSSPTGEKYPPHGVPYGNSPDRKSAAIGQIGGVSALGSEAGFASSTGETFPQRNRTSILSGQTTGRSPSSFPSSSNRDSPLGGYWGTSTIGTINWTAMDRSIQGSRRTFGVGQSTSPTRRDPSDRSSFGSSLLVSRDSFAVTFSPTSSKRSTSLHQRSLSAEYLSGRGTGVSFGGRPNVLTSQPFGRPSPSGRPLSNYGAQGGSISSKFLGTRNASGSYGLSGALQGYREQLVGGQSVGAGTGGYDGFIDDSGLGMDATCGMQGEGIGHGNPGSEGQPTVSVDPPQQSSPQREVEVPVRVEGAESEGQLAKPTISVEPAQTASAGLLVEGAHGGQPLEAKEDAGTLENSGEKDNISCSSSDSDNGSEKNE